MEKERLNFLDIGKGISIFLVVLGHACYGDNYLCNWINSFHVPVFFIISGMLLSFKDSWKSQSMKFLLIKKSKQLLYPYLTFNLIIIIYDLLLVIFKKAPGLIIKEAIIKTITLQGIDTLWFLSALFLAEIMFLFIYKYCRKKIIYFGIIFIFTILGANLLKLDFGITDNIGYALNIFLNILVRSSIACLFIEVGYKFYKIQGFIDKNSNYAVAISVIIFLISFYTNLFNGKVDLHYSKINNFILYYLFAIVTSLSILILLKYIIKTNKCLEYYGKNSLIIMATHLSFPMLEYSYRLVDVFKVQLGYINCIIVSILIMLVEIIIIEIINRKFKFIIKIK